MIKMDWKRYKIESNIVYIFENIFNNATVNIVNHVQTRLNIQFIKHEIFIIAYIPFSFDDILVILEMANFKCN